MAATHSLPTEGVFVVIWRLSAALLFALLLGGTVFYVLAAEPVAVYDEFGYAVNSRTVCEALAPVLDRTRIQPGVPPAQAATAAYEAISVRGRPPFYLPGVFLLAAFGVSWNLDLLIILQAAFWLPILFLAVVRLPRILGMEREEAAIMGAAGGSALILSDVLWRGTTALMGELPVAAATAWLVAAWGRLIRTDRLGSYFLVSLPLAIGLITKPVFPLFALPVVVHLVVRTVGRGLARRSVPGFLAQVVPRAAVAAILPGAVFWIFAASLEFISRELYLVNEVLRYYQRPENIWQDLTFPLTFFTQSYPLALAPVVAGLLLLSLRTRWGRWAAGLVVALLAVIAFFVSQRHARLFSGFVPALATVTWLGIAALPRRAWRPATMALVVAAAVVGTANVAGLDSVHALLGHGTIVIGGADADGRLEFRAIPGSPPLSLRGDEYVALRVPEIFRAMDDGPGASHRVFVGLAGDRLNVTTFQSFLLVHRVAEFHRWHFSDSNLRYGGFGQRGGLSPEFFEAAHVLTKTGEIAHLRAETALYPLLLQRALLSPGSPLLAGLEPAASVPLADGERVAVFRRLRLPDDGEWIAIALLLLTADPDNAWNVRHAHTALDAAVRKEDWATATALGKWILSFTEPGTWEPRLAARYSYRDISPELTETYARAFARVRELVTQYGVWPPR